MKKETDKLPQNEALNIGVVISSAFKPKIVNNGDVWGKGKDWFTFYCGNCGVQISSRTETCEGQFYKKGCGCKIEWT